MVQSELLCYYRFSPAAPVNASMQFSMLIDYRCMRSKFLHSSEAKKKKKTKKEKRAEKKGDAGIEMLVRNIGVKEKVEKVDFTRKRGTAETLTETYFLCNVEDKDLHLYYMLLTHPGKTLVFANSIDGVMNLVSCNGFELRNFNTENL